MTALEKLDAEIFKAETRLEELKTARRVLLEMDPDAETAEDNWPNKDFLGANIYSWCVLILVKRGQAHYREIANEAIRRGYHNARGTALESVQRSFLDTMRRDEDFVAMGKGFFKLKNHDQEAKDYAKFFQ